MSPEHENYVEYLIHVGEELTGLSLEELGYEPRPEDLSADEKTDLETWELEWMESVTPERRDQSLFQAKLLSGALWEASAVLIDLLFEDIAELRSLDHITRQDISGIRAAAQARREIRCPVCPAVSGHCHRHDR
jgi:hypothetical protein